MPNILIAEDDAMNRDMMARHLKWEGYDVITAVNGIQAVALAQSEQIDLVLMDMGMPLMDGWEATRRLKNAPVTRAIPIIALTAYAVSDDRVRCLSVGCDEYETKPINFPQLLAKMQRFLAHAAKNWRSLLKTRRCEDAKTRRAEAAIVLTSSSDRLIASQSNRDMC